RLSIMLILLNGSSSMCPISSCSSPLFQKRCPEPRTALGDTPSGENANLWYGSPFPFGEPLFSTIFPRLILTRSVLSCGMVTLVLVLTEPRSYQPVLGHRPLVIILVRKLMFRLGLRLVPRLWPL